MTVLAEDRPIARALLGCVALVASAAIPASARAGDATIDRPFAELGLTIRLPATFERVNEPAKPPVVDRWRGRVGPCDVVVTLLGVERVEFDVDEPEDANTAWITDLRKPSKSLGATIRGGETRCVEGPYGHGGYAAIVHATSRLPRGVPSAIFLASGLTADRAWTLRADVAVDPEEADARAIEQFLAKAVLCDGAPRDPKWDEADLRRRWLRAAPSSTHKKLERPSRSAHYVVLSDSPSGAVFARRLEAHHAAIEKLLPFPEFAARRLLPVYLFRTPDAYHEYYMTVKRAPRELAERKDGHVEGGFYVTHCEDLDDPVHLYNATLQILHARLVLDGGSWLGVGLGQYMSSKPSFRSVAERRAKTGEHVPFRELVAVPDLTAVTVDQVRTGVDELERRTSQAASMIECLHESNATKDRLVAAVRALGVVGPGDVAGIDEALRQALGFDLAELEKRWIAWCKKH